MRNQFIDRQIAVGNCNLFYTQNLKHSDKTPIVFLHGWGISSEPYFEILDLFADRYPIIAPDLPGFARSTCPQPVESYDDYAHYFIEFLQSLPFQKFHLIGHSLGGGISLTIAAQIPDRIQSLTLVDSTGVPLVPVPEVLVRRAIEMTAQINPLKLYLQLGEIPKVFSHNLIFNLPNVLQGLNLSLTKDLTHLFPKIQVPTFLVWSEKDLTTPLESAHNFERNIEHAKLVVVEEGFHEWGLWYPEKFTNLILSLLDQVEPSVTAQDNYSTTNANFGVS